MDASAPPDLFMKEGAGLAEMPSVDNPYLIIPKVVWCTDTDDLPGILLMEYLESAISIKVLMSNWDAELHSFTAKLLPILFRIVLGRPASLNSLLSDEFGHLFSN